MEKEELLQNINYTKNILLEKDKLQKEWNKIYDQVPYTIKLKWWVIIAIILAEILNKSYPLMSWLCLLSPILGYLYNEKVTYQRDSLISSKKNEFDVQFQQINKALTKSVIPPKYQDLWSINKIKGYLVNQRADNLKECLNLLEDEIKHNQQIENLQEIQNQNEAILQQRARGQVRKLSRN